MDSSHANPSAQLVVADSVGLFMQMSKGNDKVHSRILSLTDCATVSKHPFLLNSLRHDGRLGIRIGERQESLELYDVQRKRPLVRLPLATPMSIYRSNFSPNGQYVAWASLDGTVSVCDMERVRRELKSINAEW